MHCAKSFQINKIDLGLNAQNKKQANFRQTASLEMNPLTVWNLNL